MTATPPGGVWSSGDSAVAKVSSTGVVTGIGAGVANIYYVAGGCYAYHTVTVNAAVVISGGTSVCVGSTITLTATPPGGVWSSGDSAVAKVSSTGVVTGIGAGVANIYYVAGGCYAYHTVSVNVSATISGSSSVCAGSAITLTAIPSGGTWTTSSSAIATISSAGIVTGVAAGVVNIYYNHGGCYAYHYVTVNATATISGGNSVCTGSSITLSATPSGGTWTSSSTSVATVSTTGVVTGVSGGVVNIYYSAGGCNAYHTVSVNAAASISGSSSLCAGSSTTLTASLSGGTWTTSSSAIATVTSTGVVTGVAAGVVNIYYLHGGCYAYHTVTVNAVASISGGTTVCTGSTITLTGTPSGGSWTTSSSTIATVSSSGVVTGVAAGIVNIYYNDGGCYAYHVVTVNAAPTISGGSSVCTGSTIVLTATPSGGTWTTGSSTIATVGTTGVVTGVSGGVVNVYYVHGGCYAYHTVTVNAAASISGSSSMCVGTSTTLTASLSGGTWTTSSSAIATVTSAGVVTGVAAGVVNIYFLHGGCYAYHTVTVDAAASISGSSSVCTGSSITLTATPGGGTWTTSSVSVATVSSTGAVTGVAGGVVNIYYSHGGCYAYHTVTVNAAAAISGANSVCTGSSITLTATPSGGTWTTSSSSIATITSTGVVTGVGAGVVNIYYSSGGCFAYHTVTVNAAAAITGDHTVCVGSSITLTATPSGGSCTTSSSSVATVSSAGVVTGVGAGTVNIYYNHGGCYAYHTLTVNAAAAISGPNTVCVGSSITLTSTAAGGTWTCSSAATATVSAAGAVTGIAAGVANIYYSAGGCFAYHIVTVDAAPSIAATGTPSSCGYTYTLTATGGSTYSWLPTGGLSCASCSTTSANITATETYTVTGTNSAGCSSKATVTLDGNRIIGYLTFSTTPPDTLGAKVWLIKYNPSDSMLAAIDSTTTCVLPGGTTPYYEFNDKPAGNYLVKAKMLHDGAAGSSGYVPTYGYSSLHWYAATTFTHTAATDYTHITMLYGTVPAGPGFIGGSISMGAGKGTSGFVPAPGILVQLMDAATNNILTYTYTDENGAYAFNGLSDGDYIVYPENYVYYTTQSTTITLGSSSETVTNVDFQEHTVSRTITPVVPNAVKAVVTNGLISVYPNPASDNLNVKWQGQAAGVADVLITDIVGKQVYRSTIEINSAGQSQINVADLKEGVYMLTIRSENSNYSGKLLIQR